MLSAWRGSPRLAALAHSIQPLRRSPAFFALLQNLRSSEVGATVYEAPGKGTLARTSQPTPRSNSLAGEHGSAAVFGRQPGAIARNPHRILGRQYMQGDDCPVTPGRSSSEAGPCCYTATVGRVGAGQYRLAVSETGFGALPTPTPS